MSVHSTQTKASKQPAEHPNYAEMIIQSLQALKDRNGSSRQAVDKYVKNHLGTQHSVGLSTWWKHQILGPKLYSSHHIHTGAIQSACQGLHSLKKKNTVSPTVRDFQFENLGNFYLWNPESGKVLLVQSGFLGFGIRNTAQRIRNSTNDWNPESTFHWQRLEFRIHGVEFSTYGCFGFPGAKSFIALNWSYLLLLYFARLNFREFCTDFTYPWFSRTFNAGEERCVTTEHQWRKTSV